jgi:carbon monoxide dehydrogenase subunit G
MIKVRTSVWVPAPPEEVFAFFDDPDNMLEFTPAAQRISRFERLVDGRLSYAVTMLGSNGMEFGVEVEQVERNPPKQLTTRSHASGFTSTNARDFVPENGGTRVTSLFAAQIHRGFLSPLMELLQRDRTRLEADAIMHAVVARFAARQ